MQGLELPAPPLLVETDLLPAHEQPLTPPTPPGPVHNFPELEDTTGQARRRTTTGSGTHRDPRVLVTVLPAPTPAISTSSIAVQSTSLPSTSSTSMPVRNIWLFLNGMHSIVCLFCICIGGATGSGGGF